MKPVKLLKLELILLVAVFFAACDSPAPEISLWVEPYFISCPSEGGEYLVKLTSPQAWNSATMASWIKISPVSGKAGIADITVKISANREVADSIGKVLFTSGADTVELIVDRSGREKGDISLSSHEINAPTEGGIFTIDVGSNTQWAVSSDASWVTFTPGVGRNMGSITITVAAAQTTEQTTAILTVAEYGFGSGDVRDTVVIVREGRKPKPEDYAFTIDKDKRVIFSSGNLQYQPSSGIWRFAPKQYYILGYDNKNISNTDYSGWLDLFGWGTGNNPLLWELDVYLYTTFTDWGVNTINNDNAAEVEGKWRTMSNDEWVYLRDTRNNAEKLRGQATVSNIHGLILLPDTWETPSDLHFNPNPTDWLTNQYEDEEWQKFEKAGAVFMPAGGCRYGDNIVDQNNIVGYYWTATIRPDYSNLQAMSFAFNSKKMFMTGEFGFNYGLSVRLVKDIK